jgi:hypothetical protein
MTKQQFLEGVEFQTMKGSSFTYKFMHTSIACSYDDGDFKFEASIDSITENGFTIFTAPLGEVLRTNFEFKNLIIKQHELR